MRLRNIYIQTVLAVFPTKTEEVFLSVNQQTHTLVCHKFIVPDTKSILNPAQSRRLTRLIKTNLHTAVNVLNTSGVEQPDAILTATGLGCLEDTERFLKDLITADEQNLSPTAFIQSTHNTISSQIAMHLKCYGANYTYSQRFFSLENALLDGIMMLEDDSCKTILINCADELPNEIAAIIGRLNIINGKNLPLGEGVFSAVLSSQKNDHSHGQLLLHEYTYQLAEKQTASAWVQQCLEKADIEASQIAVVIIEDQESHLDFPAAQQLNYLKYTGQSFTSSAFAYWMASHILQEKPWPAEYDLPEVKLQQGRYVLIFHQHNNKYFSLSVLAHVEA